MPTIQFVTKITEDGVISTLDNIAESIQHVSESSDDLSQKSTEISQKMQVEWADVSKSFAITGAAIAGAGITIISTLYEMAESASKAGASMEFMSQKTGLSTEMLSALSYAADTNGSSIDGVVSGMRLLASHMEDVISKGNFAGSAFDKLGIAVTQTNGALRPASDVLLDVADKLSKMEDGATKTALAGELLGRGGLNLIPMLNTLGRDGIDALTTKVDRLNLLYTEDSTKASHAFETSIIDLHDSVTGLTRAIGEDAYPVLEKLVTGFTDVIVSVKDWVKANPELVSMLLKVSEALIGSGGLMLGIAGVITLLPKAIDLFTTFGGGLEVGLGLLTGPAGIAIAFAAVTTAVIYYHDAIFKALPETQALWDQLKQVGGVLADVAKVLGSQLGFQLTIIAEQLMPPTVLAVKLLAVGVEELILEFANWAQASGSILTAMGVNGLGGALTDAAKSIYLSSSAFDDMEAKMRISEHTMLSHTETTKEHKKSTDGDTDSSNENAAALKKQKDAIQSLVDSVIPATSAQKELAGAIQLLEQRGLSVNDLLPKMGKAASEMASQLKTAGLQVDSSIQGVANAYDFSQFLDKNTKQIAEWSNMIHGINESIAKSASQALDDASKFVDSATHAVSEANVGIAKSHADALNEMSKSVASAQAAVDQITTAQFQSNQKAQEEAAAKAEKLAKQTADAQIAEYQRMGDEFGNTFKNMDDQLASSFASMVVHAKFSMDSLKSVADDTAQSMLTSFMKGLMTPLTSELTKLGQSLGDTISKFLGIGSAGGAGAPAVTAALPEVAGLAGATTGAGTTLSTIAGGTATTIGGGTGLLGLGSAIPIVGGIAAAALALTAWVKSQAHWEANDLTKNMQGPFDQQFAALFDQVTTNQSTMSAADVLTAYNAMHDSWVDITNTVQSWAAGSSDKQQVASQFFQTEVPLRQQEFEWLGSLIDQKNAQESGMVASHATGIEYVPRDNYLANLHQGERVLTAGQNQAWGSSSLGRSGAMNFTFSGNINVQAAAGDDMRTLANKLVPALQLAFKMNTGGIKQMLRNGAGARV